MRACLQVGIANEVACCRIMHTCAPALLMHHDGQAHGGTAPARGQARCEALRCSLKTGEARASRPQAERAQTVRHDHYIRLRTDKKNHFSDKSNAGRRVQKKLHDVVTIRARMAARQRPSRREGPPSGAAAHPTAELCYYEVCVPASPSSNAQTSSSNLTRTRKTVNFFSHHICMAWL
jgi:hypothetical protein